jgi:hypothetical protein
MMALVRRKMLERLTRHHNIVVIFMHLLVFYKDIILLYLSKPPSSFLKCITSVPQCLRTVKRHVLIEYLSRLVTNFR